jgi:hypothetical protein
MSWVLRPVEPGQRFGVHVIQRFGGRLEAECVVTTGGADTCVVALPPAVVSEMPEGTMTAIQAGSSVLAGLVRMKPEHLFDAKDLQFGAVRWEGPLPKELLVAGRSISVVHDMGTTQVRITSRTTWSDVCDAIGIRVTSMWIVTNRGVRIDIRHMAQRVPPQVRSVFTL